MFCKQILFSALLPTISHAALTWTGASNIDFGTESNWLDSATMLPPPPGKIESESQINDDLEISNATVRVPQSFFVFLGNGQTMTVSDSTVTGSTNTNYHPNSVGGGGSATITLSGTTTFGYGWSWDIDWELQDTTQLVAQNANADPNRGVLGRSGSLNFASLNTSYTLTGVNYTSASPARTAFLSKLTVLGEPAVLGDNLLVTSNGGSGTVFTPIPEPSSSLLVLLGGCLMVSHRKKA